VTTRNVLDAVGEKLPEGPGRKALAGAAVPTAAAGVIAAAAARRARRRALPQTDFALGRRESLPRALRRVATEQIDLAAARLEGATDESVAEAVHGARKGFKRLRATLRLARDELGDVTYRRENTAFRDAGRALSSARDAEVLVQTLDSIEERSGARFPQLRDALEADRDAAVARLEEDDTDRAEVLGALGDARARVETWPLRRDDFRAVAPGLRRVYRRGRSALAAADREPTDERLHELRKRVKDLWHAAQLLRAARPKAMKALADDLHALSDRLGDDHDLAVLAATARGRPALFVSPAAAANFSVLVARYRDELQADALARARRLYRRKPRRFVRRIRRRWQKRARR
jgi:CHAD domain-containing protein